MSKIYAAYEDRIDEIVDDRVVSKIGSFYPLANMLNYKESKIEELTAVIALQQKQIARLETINEAHLALNQKLREQLA